MKTMNNKLANIKDKTGNSVCFKGLLEELDNELTEDQRTKLRVWFNATLLPVLNPNGGRFVFISTPFDKKDEWAKVHAYAATVSAIYEDAQSNKHKDMADKLIDLIKGTK